MQQDVRPAGERALALAVLRPALVPAREAVEPLLDRRPRQPLADRLGAKLDEDALAAVLDRREPRRLERELRALHVRLVLALDVRRDRLEAREADQRHHLAQAVDWTTALDRRRSAPSVASARRAAGARGSPVVGHVLAESLGRGEQHLELDLLDRPLGRAARLALLDRLEHLVVAERPRASPRPSASSSRSASSAGVLDELEVLPELGTTASRPRSLRSGSEMTLMTCGK